MPPPSPLRNPWLLALLAILVTAALASVLLLDRNARTTGDAAPTEPATGY